MAYDPNIQSDDQGKITIAGDLTLRSLEAAFSVDATGDLYVGGQIVPVAGIRTTAIAAEPIQGWAPNYTTGDTSIVLPGAPSADPHFNDYYFAQTFNAAGTADITRVRLLARLDPSLPSDAASDVSFSCMIFSDSAGAVGSFIAGSTGSINGAHLSADRWTVTHHPFGVPASLVDSTQYWLIIQASTGTPPPEGYPAAIQIMATSSASQPSNFSEDEQATWTALGSTHEIVVEFDKTLPIGVTDALQSAAGIGLFGTPAPASQPTGGASTAGDTYTATEKGMLQALYDAARGMGLIS